MSITDVALRFQDIFEISKMPEIPKLFFSNIAFQDLIPVFPNNNPYNLTLSQLTADDTALLVTGIAHPRSFVTFFKRYPFAVKVMRFPDHHNFGKKDIKKIKEYYSKMKGRRKIIITTEKDSVRLLHNPYFPYKLKPYLYYLPIKINMQKGIDGDILEQQIENTIKKPFNT